MLLLFGYPNNKKIIADLQTNLKAAKTDVDATQAYKVLNVVSYLW